MGGFEDDRAPSCWFRQWQLIYCKGGWMDPHHPLASPSSPSGIYEGSEDDGAPSCRRWRWQLIYWMDEWIHIILWMASPLSPSGLLINHAEGYFSQYQTYFEDSIFQFNKYVPFIMNKMRFFVIISCIYVFVLLRGRNRKRVFHIFLTPDRRFSYLDLDLR